jgi:hypothetical protein
MAETLYTKYDRITRDMPKGKAKVFFVLPSASPLIAEFQQVYVPDEDGYVRVFENDFATPLAQCVAGRGDTIYVVPGSYTISTPITLSVNDVKLIGLGTPGSTVLTGSASDIIDLTADGVEITNLRFAIASTKIAIDMAGADGCLIHDNTFTSAVGGAASYFIRMATTACNYNKIWNNQFLTNLDVSGGVITQTGHILGLGIGNVIEYNTFVAGRVTTANAGAVTDGVIFNAAADSGNIIRFNTFTEANGATFTAGVESGASAVSGSILPVANNFLLATAANAIVNTTGSAGFANNIANGTV